MEAAIATRLERVVQEVIEVRRRAQTLSEELELACAERGMLQASLEQERVALAAARVALESERTRLLATPAPADVAPVAVAEPVIEAVEPPVPAPQAPEVRASRLPSPKGLLSKLKFGENRKKTAQVLPEIPETTGEIVEITPEIVEITEEETKVTREEAEITEEIVEVTEEKAKITEDETKVTGKEIKVTGGEAKKTTQKAAPPARFTSREFLMTLPRLTDEQLDLAAFGIIQLDDDARIVALNLPAAELLQTSMAAAIDVALFETLLPDPDARTAFVSGMKKKKLDLVRVSRETLTLHLFRHTKSGTGWALLRDQKEDA